MGTTPIRPLFLWKTANITAQATITQAAGGASAPADVADESIIIAEDPNDCLNLQLYGESGIIYELAVFGYSQEAGSYGGWLCTTLLMATVTCATTGALEINGENLYPAISHDIKVNNSNFKPLDGSSVYKGPGSISIDKHGSQRIRVRVNTQSATKKANVAQRPYS